MSPTSTFHFHSCLRHRNRFLDCVLTTGGRIVANKNSSGTITGYTVYHHITDHLGSVRAITNASTGTVVETSDYLPFGTRWSQTSGSSSATITDATNRWRYSGKEEQKAINSTLPLIDYGARMYDPTIARWMSVDPMAEKYYPVSPNTYCLENPISIVDPHGDTITVNNTGYIISNDNSDDIVMMRNGDKIIPLGNLNGTVNIDIIYTNLLDEHAAESKFMWPFKLKKLVRNNGDWDLKNNKNTIWGLGNKKTTFILNGDRMKSEDVGNHHYGVVTKSHVVISEQFALEQAGEAQIKAGTSKPEWQLYEERTTWAGGYKTTLKIPLPPYGDDPNDQNWIKRGFDYYKKYK